MMRQLKTLNRVQDLISVRVISNTYIGKKKNVNEDQN